MDIRALGKKLRCVTENGAALFEGIKIDEVEYRSFRDSMGSLCFLLFGFIYLILTIVRIIVPFLNTHFSYTWLELFINYEGGFIRRGLLGEVLFKMQPVITCYIPASILIFLIYLFFTYYVIWLLQETPLLVCFFFFVSPGCLLFPVYDPAVFARKEIFELFAFIASIYIFSKHLTIAHKIIYFLLLYTVAIFIHEGALFFAPLAVCILVYSINTRNNNMSLYIILSLYIYIFFLDIILFLTINHDYNPELIIVSWRHYFNTIDIMGPMSYLNKGFGYVLRETRARVYDLNGFTFPYMADFCWTMLPVALLLLNTTHLDFFRQMKRKEPCLLAATLVALLIPFSLFCFQDWGRWIYLICLHTFLFLVALNKFGLVAYKPVSASPRSQRQMVLVFLLCYALLWRMPHLPHRPHIPG